MNLIARMKAYQDSFLGKHVVVYAIPGSGFDVDMGVRVTFNPMVGLSTEGIVVCNIVDMQTAQFVRRANRTDMKQFFASHRLRTFITTVNVEDDKWLSIGENESAILSVPEITRFAKVKAFFVGRWIYHSLEPYPFSQYLATEFVKMTAPSSISQKGMTPLDREAYAIAYADAMEKIQAEKDREKARFEEERRAKEKDLATRIQEALSVHGASLVSYRRSGSVINVTTQVPGYGQRTLTVNDDLRIVNMGICVSGRDSNYSLAATPAILMGSRRRDYYDDDDW